jgi:hypothetical protein
LLDLLFNPKKWRWYIPLKHGVFSELCDITTQKTVLYSCHCENLKSSNVVMHYFLITQILYAQFLFAQKLMNGIENGIIQIEVSYFITVICVSF